MLAGGSARRKQYYLSERLYNIYYVLRRNRRPNHLIEALIQFMAAYYSPDELRDIHARLAGEVDESDAPVRLELVLKALVNKGAALGAIGRSEEALVLSEEVLRQFDANGVPTLLEPVVKALVNTLIRVSVDLGPAPVRDRIQASPAATFLLPLTTALELEMGLTPRVAREIEEVAEDIRQRLATLRSKSRSCLAT